MKLLNGITFQRPERNAGNMKNMQNDPDTLEEYDFREGVRGKYAQRYAKGTNVVILDPDVAPFFSGQRIGE
jgi:hypothetical protein